MHSVILDARANPWGGGASVPLAVQLRRYPKSSLSFFRVGNTSSNPARGAKIFPRFGNSDGGRSRALPKKLVAPESSYASA